MNEVATFGKKISCDIPKRGHLLSKLYLHIKLPALVPTSGTYLCWTDAVGYAIFAEPIELEIGGVIVDKIYPQYLDIVDELSNKDKQLGRNYMLGKSDIYSSQKRNADKVVDIIVPLEFWFTKQYSSALPLLSMYNQDVRLNFKFRNFSQVVQYDGGDPSPVSILDSSVLAEYIFLDEIIVDQFQRQKHMYIIEQTQYHGDEIIPSNNTLYNSTLKFNHPVKELVFCCAQTSTVSDNHYFAYSNTQSDTPLVAEAALLLDGKKRFEYLPEFYFRSVFPDCVHSVIPMKHIYCMPFSLRPEDNQPTGSINMSRFNDVVLSLKLPQNNPESYLYVYAVSYNILTIENGSFVLEFAT
jgi:hypothetical protein